VFVGVYLIGNPINISISSQADQPESDRAIIALGPDPPPWAQYGRFVLSALSGDLGRSFAHGVPVLELILTRMPATMELAIVATLIAVRLGIPLGLVAGLKPDGFAGKSIMAASILGFSLPTLPGWADADHAVRTECHCSHWRTGSVDAEPVRSFAPGHHRCALAAG